MGKNIKPTPSKLIIGLIYKKNSSKDKTLRLLEKLFKNIDFQSKELDFNYTDYYYPEFGKPLKRVFVSFKYLLSEDKLADIKLKTNKLEENLSLNGKRQINIDPGFLSLGKLILATTKDNKHRIYLKKGIFAEITLFYEKDSYKPWDWTYPDYKTKEYIEAFNAIRKIYIEQLRKNVS